jgi:hypothetical protein
MINGLVSFVCTVLECTRVGSCARATAAARALRAHFRRVRAENECGVGAHSGASSTGPVSAAAVAGAAAGTSPLIIPLSSLLSAASRNRTRCGRQASCHSTCSDFGIARRERPRATPIANSAARTAAESDRFASSAAASQPATLSAIDFNHSTLLLLSPCSAANATVSLKALTNGESKTAEEDAEGTEDTGATDDDDDDDDDDDGAGTGGSALVDAPVLLIRARAALAAAR